MSLVVLMTALLLVQQAPAAAPEADTCLACHTDPQLSTKTVDGRPLGLHVDTSVFAKSVHARLACVDCHTGMSAVPHDARNFSSHRDLTLAYDEQCRRCHFANYTKTLDSVHQASVARGDRTAPVCVDCHGSHDIQKPSEPRTRISQTCARCHEGVAASYGKSVHGRNLAGAAAADVPVCTDCHRSHDIGGPHQQQWELRTRRALRPLSRRRDADEEVRPLDGRPAHLPRGLSRQDGLATPAPGHHPERPRRRTLHGLPRRARHPEGERPGSPVMKANLQKTCTKCHDDANANFPGAWLSHYEPSLKKAPIVYGVKIAYAVLIPFMIGGLGLQILLHLWRLMVNR